MDDYFGEELVTFSNNLDELIKELDLCLQNLSLVGSDIGDLHKLRFYLFIRDWFTKKNYIMTEEISSTFKNGIRDVETFNKFYFLQKLNKKLHIALSLLNHMVNHEKVRKHVDEIQRENKERDD